MKVGIHPVGMKFPGGPQQLGQSLSECAQAADEGGMCAFLLMDHYFFLDSMGPLDDPVVEGYTTLGFLAGRTKRINLGLLVTGVTYRHPGLLAKILTTLDVMSGGRAMLGLGAAWHEREHLGLGVPFPPLAERFERLEETLQICLQMFGENDGSYQGKHYNLKETINSPPVIRKPHPPILVGGMGERKALRLVAKYADASNFFAQNVDQIGAKLEVLKRHCEREGRDYSTIEKTILPVGRDPFENTSVFVDEMRGYAQLGVDTVYLIPRGDQLQFIERAARDLVPTLSGL